MNRVLICGILILSMIRGVLSAESQAGLSKEKDCEQSSGSTALIKTNFYVGRSRQFVYPYGTKTAISTSFTFSLRIMDLFEPAVIFLRGNFSEDGSNTSIYDRVIGFNAELRLAPDLWKWYEPAIGIGWFYSEYSYYWPGNENRGFYCRLGLLNIAPRALNLQINDRHFRGNIQPVVSIGELCYGPFIPWGKRWGGDLGNYYLEISLFKVGLRWW